MIASGKIDLQQVSARGIITGKGRFGGGQNASLGPITTENSKFGFIEIEDTTLHGLGLLNSEIANSLVIERSEFAHDTGINAQSMRITGNVVIRDTNADMNFAYSTIGGTLWLGGDIKTQDLQVFDYSHITQNFIIANTNGVLNIEAKFIQIGGSMDLAESHLDFIDLSGATIGAALILGEGRAGARWPNKGLMYLNGTTTQALQDRKDAWPAKLDLTEFRYQKLGTFDPLLRFGSEKHVDVSDIDNFVSRPTEWYLDWLRKQDYFSPQPYVQLITVLKANGKDRQADEIGYEGSLRREDNTKGIEKALLMFARVTTGYGYRYSYSVAWVVGFTIIGAMVFRFCTIFDARPNLTWLLVYSFGEFIPLVGMRLPPTQQVELTSFGEWYLVLHRAAGFLFSAFLAAAVAGLTQVR